MQKGQFILQANNQS